MNKTAYKVQDQKYIIYEDVKYIVNGNNVRLNHTQYEYKIAKWFAKYRKTKVFMLPEITYPQNIKSGDFIEKSTNTVWEIKEPEGITKGTTMYNQFKNQKEKARHFIIDIHNCKVPLEDILNDLNSIMLSKRYGWIEKIIVLNNLVLIKKYKKR